MNISFTLNYWVSVNLREINIRVNIIFVNFIIQESKYVKAHNYSEVSGEAE